MSAGGYGVCAYGTWLYGTSCVGPDEGGARAVDWHGIEFDYYIPPDVPVAADGTIHQVDWPKVYRLMDDGTKCDGQWLLSFTGMGMPPIKYVDQTGPYQHGSTLLDYRLQPRLIQYVHRRNAGSRSGYWWARGDFVNWIRPNRQLANSFGMGRLRKVIPSGAMLDVDAMIQQGPAFTARSNTQWDEWGYTETIRFICPDPTFYDPVQQSIEWELEAYDGLIFFESPGWEEHLIFPIVFGADAFLGYKYIIYSGTWLSYPTITITGPLNYPTIENATIGEKIAMNYEAGAGETITIGLRYGQKTVTNNLGANLIGTLTDDSDLASFHIAPDPEAPGGINQFLASGSGATVAVSKIELAWYTRYIGI